MDYGRDTVVGYGRVTIVGILQDFGTNIVEKGMLTVAVYCSTMISWHGPHAYGLC